MQQFLVTLGYGFLALVAVAGLVALWEHLHRSANARQAVLPPAGPPRAVHVDVDLAELDGTAAAGDSKDRQAAVSGALTRMSTPPAGPAPGSSAWTETRPMVAPGTASEPQPH